MVSHLKNRAMWWKLTAFARAEITWYLPKWGPKWILLGTLNWYHKDSLKHTYKTHFYNYFSLLWMIRCWIYYYFLCPEDISMLEVPTNRCLIVSWWNEACFTLLHYYSIFYKICNIKSCVCGWGHNFKKTLYGLKSNYTGAWDESFLEAGASADVQEVTSRRPLSPGSIEVTPLTWSIIYSHMCSNMLISSV